MEIVGLLLVLAIFSVLFGRVFVQRALKKRTERRERLFRIAAGNLEDVEILPATVPWRRRLLAGTQPRRRGWFWHGEEEDRRPPREKRDRLYHLAAELDCLLQERTDALDMLTRAEAALKEQKAATAATIPNAMSEPNSGKWWSNAVQAHKRKRVATRNYFAERTIYGRLVYDHQRRIADLNTFLHPIIHNQYDVSYIGEQGFMAVETAINIGQELCQETWAPFEAATQLSSEPEPEEAMRSAEELCAELPHLVHEALAATRKTIRLGREVQQLREQITTRGSKISLDEPTKPVEKEVEKFVNGALEWTSRGPKLDRELLNTLADLREATSHADELTTRIHQILADLKAHPQEFDVVYEDDLTQLQADDKERGGKTVLFVKKDGTSELVPPGIRLIPEPSPKPYGPQKPWAYEAKAALDTGPAKPAAPDKPATTWSWSNLAANRIGNREVEETGANRFGRDERADRRVEPLPGVAYRWGLEPPKPVYTKPELARPTKKWFISDQAFAVLESAQDALDACKSAIVREYASPHPPAEEMVSASARDTEMQALMMNGLRKIGFAVAQLKAANEKRSALEARTLDHPPEPSLDVQDVNALVQSVGSWQAQKARAEKELWALTRQRGTQAEQCKERQQQLSNCMEAVIRSLDEHDLLEEGLPASLELTLFTLKRVLLHYDSHLAAKLKSKKQREEERIAAEKWEAERPARELREREARERRMREEEEERERKAARKRREERDRNHSRYVY